MQQAKLIRDVPRKYQYHAVNVWMATNKSVNKIGQQEMSSFLIGILAERWHPGSIMP